MPQKDEPASKLSTLVGPGDPFLLVAWEQVPNYCRESRYWLRLDRKEPLPHTASLTPTNLRERNNRKIGVPVLINHLSPRLLSSLCFVWNKPAPSIPWCACFKQGKVKTHTALGAGPGSGLLLSQQAMVVTPTWSQGIEPLRASYMVLGKCYWGERRW